MDSYLSTWDYLIIGISLLLSSGFGLYNGCFKKKQSTFFEYFLGSQSISMLPLAISSFSTIAASGLMIGFSAEVYSYGIGVLLIIIPYIFLIPVINGFVIPVYRKFKSGNIFEFYEIRYSKTFKKVAIVLYIISSINFASVTIYGPSIAMSLAMNQNIWVVVSFMIGICMIYTVLGGMRAVVFADIVQGLQILIVMVILMIFGTISIGGFSKVWRITSEGERLQLDFSSDPTVTHTVWSTLIGWMISCTCFFAINQPNIQRLMACATLKQAQKINIISIVMFIAAILFMGYLGLLAYATFSKCDPMANNEIKSLNQIFPYYVMKTLSEYPGLPGLYFAGLVAAALSTLSSFLNSLACISIDTFILSKYPNMLDDTRTKVCKLLTFLFGGLTVLSIVVIRSFPNVMQGGTVLVVSVSCPLFALFVIGIFCPRVNSKGGIIAFTLSFLFGIYLIIGVLLFPSSIMHMKPTSIEGCPASNPLNATLFDMSLNSSTVSTYQYLNETTENILNINSTQSSYTPSANSFDFMKAAFPLASMSYLWLGCIIFALPLVLSVVFTCILGKNVVDEYFLEYIPPIIQRFHNKLSPKQREWFLCDVPDINRNRLNKNEECVPLAQLPTNITTSQSN